MPTISQFFGIIIQMFYDDHNPPHFHVRYAEHQAEIVISTGKIKAGKLPKTAYRLVDEWRLLHVNELLKN